MFDWLLTPQVVPALAGLCGVLLGSLISWGVQGQLLVRRIAADESLAERKFKFDIELAERRFKYDRDLHNHKRSMELAEAVLVDFYRVEEIYRLAREPFTFNGELGTKEGVAEEVASDSHFVPAWRLTKYEEYFARFRVRKHEFAAVFGKEAAVPFDIMLQVASDIHVATDCLLRHKEVRSSREPSEIELYREWFGIIFRSPDEAKDEIAQRIKDAIGAIEKTCRPAIEAGTKP